MRRIVAAFAVMAVALGSSPAQAQGIKNPAELLPAKTLAYVEVRRPGELAKEIAGLLEGSYLSNVPESLAPLLAKASSPGKHVGYVTRTLAMSGMVFAPEVIREVGRLRGVAVAVTGIDKEEPGMPEFVVIVLPGNSNFPGLMMRLFMTAFSSEYGSSGGNVEVHGQRAFERIAEVEGVGLYRHVDRRTTIRNGQPEKPEVRIGGPALALMPDALLVGSPELVKGVIRRAKGKGDGPSLAGLESFKKAAQDVSDKPGLFAFANPAPVIELLEQIDLGREWREMLTIAKQVVNPKAFVAVADQVILENGTLHYRRRVYLDAKEKSPILEILPSKAISRNLLHFAEPDALLFAAVANDDGDKRWQRLVDLADNLFKGGGDRDLPSRAVAELERGLGLSIGKDVIGKIRGAAVAMPGMQALLKADMRGGPPLVLIVEATDEQAAANLAEEVVPKAFAMMARGREVHSAERKLAGHTLRTLQTKGTMYTLNHGRVGSTLVFGPIDTAVAQALTHGQKKQGLLADAKNAKRIEELKDPIAVGLMRPLTAGGAMSLYFASLAHRAAEEAGRARKLEPGAPKQVEPRVELPKEALQVLDLLKAEQPLLLSMTRTPDQLTL